MSRNVAQYPGTNPARERMRLPRVRLRSAVWMTCPPGVPLLLCDPKPIAESMMDEFRPRP